jgi:hypothetical protein
LSNASRIAGKTEKKVRQPRVKKVKVNLDSLKSVFEEDKLIAKINDEVVFLRVTSGKSEIHEGTISGIGDAGLITIWDDTRGQYFMFDMKQELPVIKFKTLLTQK